MSSRGGKLSGVSARREHCTATVAFWTRSLIFRRVSNRNLYRVPHLNITAPKCSRMGFRKDKRRTSTEDSRPTPTFSPMTTSICPTATSRMKNLKRTAAATRSRDARMHQTHKHPKPLSPIARCRVHRSRHPKSKMTTSCSHLPPHIARFANPKHRAKHSPTRMGKIAIIRDMGAVTCVQCSL